jgi:uncharacterized protein HemX
MSDSKTDSEQPTEETPAVDQDATFPDDEAHSDDPAEYVVTPDKPERARSGRVAAMVAWLALIVAAGAVLFAFYQTRDDGSDTAAASRAEAEIASLTASLAATRDSLDGLQNRLSTLSESDAANLRSMQSLERQLNDQFGQLESLPGRIGNLESSISALRGISSGVRDAWLLAEAEYYMQIGNAQLQLVGNPHLATLALRLADERIEELANPALTSVRRALAVELRSLDAMAKPDIEGIALTLASLATVVDSLPLREQLRALDEDVTEEELESELTGMDRAFASLKRTMSGIVSVRRTDAPLEPLLAPDERYFLRANLALQLQAARLALLQGEESLFEHSLDDATLWLEQYYDSENAAVSSALQTISEIRAVSFDVDVPDISESLRLLRQHNTLSEAAAEAPEMPDSDPEPAATEIEQ